MPDAKIVQAGQIIYHTKFDYSSTGRPATSKNYPLEERHLPILSYEGYNFLGWYYDEIYTSLAKVGDIVTELQLNLYAKWQPTVFTAMTLIADEIRNLSGTEETMSLSAMESYIGEANTEVAIQADLIAQIASALKGKTVGGSGVQTIPFTLINLNGSAIYECYTELGLSLAEWSESENNTTGIDVSVSTMLGIKDRHDPDIISNKNAIRLETIAPYVTYYINV